jgi:hypothetical protein
MEASTGWGRSENSAESVAGKKEGLAMSTPRVKARRPGPCRRSCRICTREKSGNAKVRPERAKVGEMMKSQMKSARTYVELNHWICPSEDVGSHIG